MLSMHAQFLTDDKGNRTAVVLPIEEWEAMQKIIEEFLDINAYDKAKAEISEPVSLEEALQELKINKEIDK